MSAMVIDFASADDVTKPKSREEVVTFPVTLPVSILQQSVHQCTVTVAPVIQEPLPVASGCFCQDTWAWDYFDRSPQVSLQSSVSSAPKSSIEEAKHRAQHQQSPGHHHNIAVFHPSWSSGTAAVRGTKPLCIDSVHYWEIHVTKRLFGTSLQFGVATKSSRLHADSFVNLLGEDEHSWALSHKGLLWHHGESRLFAEPFNENESVTIGLLFDGPRGTLTFYKNRVLLGVGFTGLNKCDQPLYPAISSTAARTEMQLTIALRSFASLQDRCREVIVRRLATTRRSADSLPLPLQLKRYLQETSNDCRADNDDTTKDGGSQSQTEVQSRRHVPTARNCKLPGDFRSLVAGRARLCLKYWPDMTSH